MELPEKQPILNTSRLTLRPFDSSDAAAVQKLMADKSIYETTINIPYPYEVEDALQWIAQHREDYQSQKNIVYAITSSADHQLIGSISLLIHKSFNRGEFGYWLGKAFWNNGYCTEALQAILEFGFLQLQLNRIYAPHMKINPASGRVMQKNGLRYEGCLRGHLKKNSKYEDLEYYGILKSEFEIKD